jgi:hypothetical protein
LDQEYYTGQLAIQRTSPQNLAHLVEPFPRLGLLANTAAEYGLSPEMPSNGWDWAKVTPAERDLSPAQSTDSYLAVIDHHDDLLHCRDFR